jgi:hypothetical protein
MSVYSTRRTIPHHNPTSHQLSTPPILLVQEHPKPSHYFSKPHRTYRHPLKYISKSLALFNCSMHNVRRKYASSKGTSDSGTRTSVSAAALPLFRTRFPFSYGGGHLKCAGRPRCLRFFVAMTGVVTGMKTYSSDTV